MDGKTARLFTERLIHAVSKADLANRKLTHDFMNAGAEEFVSRVNCIKETQSITTVADQADYDLNGNYLRLYLKTGYPRGGNYFILYNNGTTEYRVLWKAYQRVIYDNNTTSIALPSGFTIHEKTSLGTQVTGTTTSAGAQSGGQSTLTDTAGSFTSDDIQERDIVHNSTGDYTGIVLSTPSTDTAITTAMFDHDGNPVGWASGDTYVIQPAARYQLQLDPPPSTASHTITTYYLAKPNPVYTDYGTWQIMDVYHKAFCYWAADSYLAEYELKDVAQTPFMVVGQKYKNIFNEMVVRARRDFDLALAKSGYSMRGDVRRSDYRDYGQYSSY
jgi:hypothetical protein